MENVIKLIGKILRKKPSFDLVFGGFKQRIISPFFYHEYSPKKPRRFPRDVHSHLYADDEYLKENIKQNKLKKD